MQSYVVSNVLPTLYYVEDRHDTSHLDPSKDDYFVAMAQATQHPGKTYGGPGDIVMFSGTTLHSGSANLSDVTAERTFLRVIFSQRLYNRSNNTHNTAFDDCDSYRLATAGWEPRDRSWGADKSPRFQTEEGREPVLAGPPCVDGASP